ncbi:MAG: threonine/serine exporter family protein, partial [Muribaculaceae bacterium]|nr:threonine/serine exporter family protein [Muribaculaceae bacterium]
MLIFDLLKDALFAAIAAIGFGAISRIPRRAYLWCGLIAAIGHSLRFLLMGEALGSMNIIVATAIAAFVIGSLSVFVSPFARTPAEAYLF